MGIRHLESFAKRISFQKKSQKGKDVWNLANHIAEMQTFGISRNKARKANHVEPRAKTWIVANYQGIILVVFCSSVLAISFLKGNLQSNLSLLPHLSSNPVEPWSPSTSILAPCFFCWIQIDHKIPYLHLFCPQPWRVWNYQLICTF